MKQTCDADCIYPFNSVTVELLELVSDYLLIQYSQRPIHNLIDIANCQLLRRSDLPVFDTETFILLVPMKLFN